MSAIPQALRELEDAIAWLELRAAEEGLTDDQAGEVLDLVRRLSEVVP